MKEKQAKVRKSRIEKLEIQFIDHQEKMKDLQLKRESEKFDFQTQIMNLQRKLDFVQEDLTFSQKEFDESSRSILDSQKKLEEMFSAQQELQRMLTESNGETESIKARMKRDAEIITRLRSKNSKLRKGLDQMTDSLLCIICSEKICDAIFWPCKHQTVCEDCCKNSDLKE
jgi:chromosome segregation ATPase